MERNDIVPTYYIDIDTIQMQIKEEDQKEGIIFIYNHNNDITSESLEIATLTITNDDQYYLYFGLYVKEEDYKKVLNIIKNFGLRDILKEKADNIIIEDNTLKNSFGHTPNCYRQMLEYIKKENLIINGNTEVGKTKRKIRDIR